MSTRIVIILVISIFISAFGVVYAKDLNRRLLIELQTVEKENSLANERWGKLLLARGILARESRIHHLASTRLHMVAPAPHEVRVIK
jgi:cell division protein FtsL